MMLVKIHKDVALRYLLLVLIPFFLFAHPFTVATYNVENLFDAVRNGTEYEEFIPGRHGWSERMAQVKLDRTAEVICDIDADIIGLQEVENEAVFEALRRRLSRAGCAYRYGVITHKRSAPIQVGLLSRFPIVNSQELQVSYSPRVRNILEATVKVEGYPLTLFVNHWKSKSRKGYESKRIAYAKALAKRLRKMPASKEYIILGDLNTNYDAHLTLPERLNDSGGRTGLNDVLQTAKGEDLLSVEEVIRTKGAHYDLWQELPFSKRWSHKYYGRKSTLDHILLPASMFDGRGIDYVSGSFGVFKRSYLFTKKGYINGWQIKAGKHTGRGYSDHLPIVATFDTKAYIPSHKIKQHKPVEDTIEMLYQKEKLDNPIILKDAVVVLKRGRYAVIKQSPNGRGIFVYGTAEGLEEGRRYDLQVQEIHTYKGLKEITAMVRLKERGEARVAEYYSGLERLRQNEVVADIIGTYKRGYLYVQSGRFLLYFKNRHIIPKEGSKLKISIAHIGYYKRLQLVVYSRKDFTILE